MTLIELINLADKDKTIELLFDIYYSQYSLSPIFDKNDYMMAILELKKIVPNKSKGIIFVYPAYKFNENNEIVLDDCPVVIDDLDIKDLNIKHISYNDITNDLFVKEWSDILLYNIFDKSIKRYGNENVLSKILFELFWFGLSNKEHEKNIKKEKERIFEPKNYFDNDVISLFNELQISYKPDYINVDFQKNIDEKNKCSFNNFIKL